MPNAERLNLALDIAGVGAWDWNVGTGDVAFTDTYYTMLGYEPQEYDASFEAWANALHPDDKETAQAAIGAHVEGGDESFVEEFRMMTKGGDAVWIRSAGRVVERDDEGGIKRLIGTHTDITEQKKREQQLRLMEFTNQKAAYEIFWIRPDATFAYVNDETCEKLGYTREELLDGMEVFDIDPVVPRDQFAAIVDAVREQGSMAIESQHKKRNGEVYPVEITNQYISFEGTELICATARDVSEEKEAQRQAALFQSAIETATNGISMGDLEGKVIYSNQACAEMFGFDHESQEMIGLAFSDLWPDEMADELQNEILPAVMEGGWSGEVPQRRKDGDFFEAQISLSPVYDENGEIEAISAVFADITEQKQLEMELYEQNQMIAEMSTPVITLWDEIVLLPLVGSIDDDRAMQMTERLLETIVGSEARVAILDVTGIAEIDTSVARNLLKAVDAAKMLGAQIVVTGFSPDAAQTLAQLGVDLRELNTRGSLKAGISDAFQMVNQEVVGTGKKSRRQGI